MLFDIAEKILEFFVYKVFRSKMSEEVFGLLWQFCRYAMVGVSNFLVSSLIFLLFYEVFGVKLEISNFIGFTISVVNACYWSNRYVFKAEEGTKRVWWQVFIKTYIAYAFFSLILHTILLKILVEKWGVPSPIALIILLFVITPLSYLANKFWAYRDRKEEPIQDGEDCNSYE